MEEVPLLYLLVIRQVLVNNSNFSQGIVELLGMDGNLIAMRLLIGHYSDGDGINQEVWELIVEPLLHHQLKYLVLHGLN